MLSNASDGLSPETALAASAGCLTWRLAFRAARRLVRVRDRHDLPPGRRLEQLHRVHTTMTRRLAEVEVVLGPHRRQRAADAHLRRPRALDPGRALVGHHERPEPIPRKHLNDRLAVRPRPHTTSVALGSKISRNAATSLVRMASNSRCTVASTAFVSASEASCALDELGAPARALNAIVIRANAVRRRRALRSRVIGLRPLVFRRRYRRRRSRTPHAHTGPASRQR